MLILYASQLWWLVGDMLFDTRGELHVPSGGENQSSTSYKEIGLWRLIFTIDAPSKLVQQNLSTISFSFCIWINLLSSFFIAILLWSIILWVLNEIIIISYIM